MSTSLANGIETTWAEIGKMIVLVLNDLLYINKFSSEYSCFFLFLKTTWKHIFSHYFRAQRPQLKGIHWTNLQLIPTSIISWFVISLYMQLGMRFSEGFSINEGDCIRGTSYCFRSVCRLFYLNLVHSCLNAVFQYRFISVDFVSFYFASLCFGSPCSYCL